MPNEAPLTVLVNDPTAKEFSALILERFPEVRVVAARLIVTNASGVHGEIIADFVITGVGMLHWGLPANDPRAVQQALGPASGRSSRWLR